MIEHAPYKSFRDIPQFVRTSEGCDVPLDMLEHHVERWVREYGFQMTPDFQRGHVWSETQQIAFVEFLLRGGQSGRNLYVNHPGWMRGFEGEFVLIDGLQRLTAALRFVRDEIPAFGRIRRDYDGRIPFEASFRFCIATLQTRAEMLRWYIDLNAGGVVHTSEEIERVRGLLAAAESGARP